MKNKWMISTLVLAVAVPFTGIRISAASELERLEKAVKNDQTSLQYAGVGMHWRYAQLERQQARKRLAQDQAALEAFKTLGPQAKQAQLEAAVRRDQAALEYAGKTGTKMLYAQMERQNARDQLARDQAVLEAFKTAGPKSEIPALEQAVRNDEAALRFAGFGEKMVYAQQSRAAAQSRLAQHQAELAELKGQ